LVLTFAATYILLRSKVGVYQSEVVYGAPSHEPYPDLARETESYTYTGGKDNQVRLTAIRTHAKIQIQVTRKETHRSD
jgi:hypothetical protein